MVKKTWIDPNDYTILKSRMFRSLQDAKLYKPESKGNNYLYFQLSPSDDAEELIYYGENFICWGWPGLAEDKVWWGQSF